MARHFVRWIAAAASVMAATSGCSTITGDTASEQTETTSVGASAPPTTSPGSTSSQQSTIAAPATVPTPPQTRPPWLGQRPLVTNASGFGIPEPTPEELVDRMLPTIDTLPPPPSDGTFVSTIEPLAGAPLELSTWEEGCPVPPEGLAYVTVSFHGFDGVPHTGELIVAAEWAVDIVGVFEVAWNDQYPFEEMRIVTPADVDAEPTGDGNNTSSFVCRAVTGGSRFSEHAYGLAIDINPFHNPYIRNDVILPELADSYLERDHLRVGMLITDSTVVQAFKDIGWFWGGEWSSLKDWQHFSQNGQ